MKILILSFDLLILFGNVWAAMQTFADGDALWITAIFITISIGVIVRLFYDMFLDRRNELWRK